MAETVSPAATSHAVDRPVLVNRLTLCKPEALPLVSRSTRKSRPPETLQCYRRVTSVNFDHNPEIGIKKRENCRYCNMLARTHQVLPQLVAEGDPQTTSKHLVRAIVVPASLSSDSARLADTRPIHPKHITRPPLAHTMRFAGMSHSIPLRVGRYHFLRRHLSRWHYPASARPTAS